MPLKYQRNIDWLGHASFRIRGEKTVYIDPWKIKNKPHDADIILITHTHYDHYSREDIVKIDKDSTIIVAPQSTSDEIQGDNVVFISPGEIKDIGGIRVEAVPAYNINKKFHPKEKNWLGYIIEKDGFRVYHTGDTDLIPEMNDLKCDICLVPVSGTYVMTSEEALTAIDRIKPQLAIPMHWGDIVGEKSDADNFIEFAMCNTKVKDIVA